MRKSKEQISAAYAAWAENPTPTNMSGLLRLLDPDINSIVATYGGQQDDNVKWAARVHLAEQIRDRFDPTKSNINTFIYQSLQRLPRIISTQRNAVHVPESSDYDMRQLRQTQDTLEDRFNRQATNEELADESGISLDRIHKLNNRFSRPSVPGSTIDGGMGATVAGSGVSAQGELWKNYTIDALSKDDKNLYNWLNQPKPLPKAEIARRLKISPPAVSQRINKLEKELRFNENP